MIFVLPSKFFMISNMFNNEVLEKASKSNMRLVVLLVIGLEVHIMVI